MTLINAAEESFDLGGRRLPLSGSYDPRFRGVVEAFVENYRLGDELGSAVSIVVDGRTVVDVWGGWTDLNRQTEWQRDTIVCMMSVAKGITAAGFFVLVDRGLIDVDAPVATYWPEFAQNGKADIPVRHVLDHRSGLPVVTDRLVPRGAIYDREAMVRALEAQPPLWPTGEVAAYHILTQGYLLGEIMRRVSGQTVGPFVRENVTGPLGADYHIGLPASEDERVAELFPHPEARLLASRDVDEPDSLRAIAFIQHPEQPWGDILNSREWRAAEIASASGHGNARAVARVYAALARGGELDGV
ncbi:MAG TPA: serine hydrolase domain-containing protein, partial [Pseudolysinimonas sp.]|nr:serine hydrolase domain-containing protein [Pseudolysinimonas sp.]